MRSPAPTVEAVLHSLEAPQRATAQARIALIARASANDWPPHCARRRRSRRIWPSDANFLLVECRMPTAFSRPASAARLLVRDFRAQPGLANCLRISVGTPEQNERLIAAVERRHDCRTRAVRRSRRHAHRGAPRSAGRSACDKIRLMPGVIPALLAAERRRFRARAWSATRTGSALRRSRRNRSARAQDFVRDLFASQGIVSTPCSSARTFRPDRLRLPQAQDSAW